jgi:alkylation response protein AidB-like acyl-CoA dehydrogenase
MTFEDVFIPNGWWHKYNLSRGGGIAGVAGFPFIAIMLLGMGEAAYRAELEFIRNQLDRPIWPIFEGPKDDVFIHRRLGKHKTALAAARALVLQAARDAENADENADRQALQMQAAAARQAATQASLYVSADMFELTGARSTASKYDMDRFWRNSRTLGIHDPADVDYAAIGFYEINGSISPALMQRVQRTLRKPAPAS